MPVTDATGVERQENLGQIDRLVASSVLQGSESLCKLLRYLAEQALDHPGISVKEYQIATEVFGRPSYFDPRLDSTVRVQTGRLRSKLSEYYAGAGADDPVVVEIPKGSYTLAFHPRVRHAVPTAVSAPVTGQDLSGVVAEPMVKPDLSGRALVWALVCVCSVLAVSVLILSWIQVARSAYPAKAAVVEPGVPTLRALWKPFVEDTENPWAIFSNAEFTGRPETGIRYFNPATDSRDSIIDHYTGVGEVLGIHELDRVFTLLGHGLSVKRGRLLSLDDAKNHNLIFVGSPSENLPLRVIQTSQDFVFRRVDTPGRKGDLAIVNAHPRKDEQKLFYASPGLPLTDDYAIIALVPGINRPRWVMVLAGTTTLGTQAAVEYVCRAQTVEDLLTRLTGSKTGTPGPFEAVLHAKVSQGVPVDAELIAFHTR